MVRTNLFQLSRTVRASGYLLAFFLILGQFSCKFQAPKSPEKIAQERADSIFYAHPVYKVYGLPPENNRQVSQAAQLMGFSYLSVAGCEVDPKLVISVEANNRKADSILQFKIGKNWEEILYQKADSLFTLSTKAIKLAKTNPLVNKVNHQFENHLIFIADPIQQNGLFFIRGYKSHWADSNHNKVFLKDHVKMEVDINNGRIISIDTTTTVTDTINLF